MDSQMSKRIIFHHPLPLNPEAKSASGIRPQRMLKTFREIGYEVDIVAGYGRDRKKAIDSIKENIKSGIKYDFMYAESSTMPTTLTESHHFPTHPFLDFFFFLFCRKNNIPIGLFYRDIFWLFENYKKSLNPFKYIFAITAYRFDLWVYQITLKKLFLPSLQMGAYVPTVSSSKFSPLPPGHFDNLSNEKILKKHNERIQLFYVGGLSHLYRLHKLFHALKDFPSIDLTVCTREAEWLQVKEEYPILGKNISIIHKVGEEMEAHLWDADIAVFSIEPHQYSSFAAPVKIYEYIGYGKPILASKGTLAADFVQQQNIGWSIDYDETALHTFLTRISQFPEEIERIKKNIHSISKSHTWRARAEQVIRELKA